MLLKKGLVHNSAFICMIFIIYKIHRYLHNSQISMYCEGNLRGNLQKDSSFCEI